MVPIIFTIDFGKVDEIGYLLIPKLLYPRQDMSGHACGHSPFLSRTTSGDQDERQRFKPCLSDSLSRNAQQANVNQGDVKISAVLPHGLGR